MKSSTVFFSRPLVLIVSLLVTAINALPAPIASTTATNLTTVNPASETNNTAATSTFPNTLSGLTTLSIATHNVYFLSMTLFPNWGQDIRAKLISTSTYVQYHDVIVFEEAFAAGPRATLQQGLIDQYPYQTDVIGRTKSGWTSSTGSYSSVAPENGGVMLMSKWPIKEKRQHTFKRACGADWFSNKGFVYALIDRNGTNLHILGTHMQSDDSMCSTGQAADIRSSQLSEIRTFIDSLSIPIKELVIFMGDFNINKFLPEYNSSLLTILKADPPTNSLGYSSTYDPKSNSIAGYNYPGGVEEYIDHVVTDGKHGKVKVNEVTVVKVKSPEWVVKGDKFDDYSDHYPLVSIIQAEL